LEEYVYLIVKLGLIPIFIFLQLSNFGYAGASMWIKFQSTRPRGARPDYSMPGGIKKKAHKKMPAASSMSFQIAPPSFHPTTAPGNCFITSILQKIIEIARKLSKLRQNSQIFYAGFAQ